MHWADINAAMIKAGWPPLKTAKHLGVASPAVSQITRGTATSYNIATFISVKTSIPLNTLWPDGRYAKPSIRPLTRKQQRKAA